MEQEERSSKSWPRSGLLDNCGEGVGHMYYANYKQVDRSLQKLLLLQQSFSEESFGTTAKMVLWVFGYGSLIWRTGFNYDERVIGYVKDYKRVFHQGSYGCCMNSLISVTLYCTKHSTALYSRALSELSFSLPVPCRAHTRCPSHLQRSTKRWQCFSLSLNSSVLRRKR